MNGTYRRLDIESVRNGDKKIVEFLKNTLRKTDMREFVVIFLGEEHGNAIDEAVTQAILLDPPILSAAGRLTGVMFERLLDNKYVPCRDFGWVRTEYIDHALSRQERSAKIADTIIRAFSGEDVTIIYVVCGSAHSKEIFNGINKRLGAPFTYVSKPSCTD